MKRISNKGLFIFISVLVVLYGILYWVFAFASEM